MDEKQFDIGIKGLFRVVKTIVNINNQRLLKLDNKKNPVLVCLEQYQKVYDKTTPKEHKIYFSDIYEKYKSVILKGPNRDDWLTSNRLSIKYGSHVGMNTKARIYLSAVYITACKIRNEVEESMKGLPNIEESKEIQIPSAFLLHMYRIFKSIAPSSDHDKLNKHIESLKCDLGIIDNQTTTDNSDVSDTLEPLVNMASKFMGKMGVEIPEGKMPPTKQLTDAVGQIFNNPKTSEMLTNIFGEFQKSNNIGDLMNSIVSNIGNPELTNAVKETINTQNNVQGADLPNSETQNGKKESGHDHDADGQE